MRKHGKAGYPLTKAFRRVISMGERRACGSSTPLVICRRGFKLHDSLGSLVLNRPKDCIAGTNRFVLAVTGLPDARRRSATKLLESKWIRDGVHSLPSTASAVYCDGAIVEHHSDKRPNDIDAFNLADVHLYDAA